MLERLNFVRNLKHTIAVVSKSQGHLLTSIRGFFCRSRYFAWNFNFGDNNSDIFGGSFDGNGGHGYGDDRYTPCGIWPADEGYGENSENAPTQIPTSVVLPEEWPHVPLLATTRCPLFPRFIKVMDITSPHMIELLRYKIRISEPFVGVFLKKKETKFNHIYHLDEVYRMGTFGQIQEVQNIGKNLRVMVVAHRRILIAREVFANVSQWVDDLFDKEEWQREQELTDLLEEEEHERLRITEMILNDNFAYNFAALEGKDTPTDRAVRQKQKVDEETLSVLRPTNITKSRLGEKWREMMRQKECIQSRLAQLDFEQIKRLQDVRIERLERIKLLAQQQREKASEQEEILRQRYVRSEREPVLMVEVDNVKQPSYKDSPEVESMTQMVIEKMREVVNMNPLYKESLEQMLNQNQRVIDNPIFLCDLTASLSVAKPAELQQILHEQDLKKRLDRSLALLNKELELSRLQAKIGREVEDKIKDKHRDFVLNEQMRMIKKELGVDKDDKDAICERFREKLKEKNVPDLIMAAIDEELQKLNYLESHSSEFNVTRNYLDCLVSLPWGIVTRENLNLDSAIKILNNDHYGIEDVKKRILEFIAVSSLKGSTQGRILCFYGPPGVGKTSIARSIARALNREYFRFSVGGMTDVAEIKGHRRTYVGAMPGKIIHCLKKTQTENPLVLIDEIDKLGKGFQGDPSSAILELFDNEQNNNFYDHYLDLPVDLSHVLFICTANVIESIPEALRDRMEVIEMSGYVTEEKIGISRQYLIPLAMKECGLKKQQVCFTDDALSTLIRYYCRESGVRNLQKHIDKIIRKIAYRIVKGEGIYFIVNEENLTNYVGKRLFTSDRLYMTTPVGVAMGLAWTVMGGTALYVETAKCIPKSKAQGNYNGSIFITGNLGPVMKESVQIALTIARNYLYILEPENLFLESEKIHLHIPEGATHKEGPSAGVTIITALISLAMNMKVRPNVAMTGEVTLRGKLLLVGSIKEKVIAAKRCGVRVLILPEDNRKDFMELPAFIRDGLTVYFASTYKDVYYICFGDHPRREKLPELIASLPLPLLVEEELKQAEKIA